MAFVPLLMDLNILSGNSNILLGNSPLTQDRPRSVIPATLPGGNPVSFVVGCVRSFESSGEARCRCGSRAPRTPRQFFDTSRPSRRVCGPPTGHFHPRFRSRSGLGIAGPHSAFPVASRMAMIFSSFLFCSATSSAVRSSSSPASGCPACLARSAHCR